MKKFLSEFKGFIMKGNVLDLAVGVIIGAAFQKVVSSLVNDILMPLISVLVQADIKQWYFTLKPGTPNNPAESADSFLPPSGWEVAPIRLTYGNFIQTIIDFLIIGLVLFVIVKVALASEKLRAKAVAELAEKQKEETK
ncbi:MAG TPA: large conductance mechanosensitive channel protein MscL [Bacilli bacterium]|mgnify:CR=1 FL=1|nr:large conductance mechanosensitive channel protein MscL [Bacilli bacterium]